MKIFKYLIESIFIYTFFLIIKLIGLKQSRKIFSLLFRAVGPLIRSSKIIRKNATMVYENKCIIKRVRGKKYILFE